MEAELRRQPAALRPAQIRFIGKNAAGLALTFGRAPKKGFCDDQWPEPGIQFVAANRDIRCEDLLEKLVTLKVIDGASKFQGQGAVKTVDEFLKAMRDEDSKAGQTPAQ